MTDAEFELWKHLKNKQLGVRFRRQSPIGNYIVDFVSFEAKLVIEVDGGQHAESTKDGSRDKYLKSQGFRVLRFWNNEVLGNIEGVLDKIGRML
jgi:very-short-patch-repair endonuclease